ncbi:MAG: hypothetical protein IRZ05_11005 [Micromonosporaceae bacterium]|nr:hypothetical protein [Micromonosporaceae bacterium]
MGMAEPLTEEEKQALKAAAFGAVYLVSNADHRGVVNVLRESFAATAALAGSSGLVREVLTSGPPPKLPKPPPAEEASVLLAALRRAVAILAAKAPQELDRYRSTVVDAVNRVAGTAQGVSEPEADMIDRVRQALAG